ncbi:MAG TPA: hypothetical protein VGT41_05420 [Candidatus Babeliales bacterium]|nr:hypothetical protein [Candidatus Babeliales bacterium]
MAIQGTTLQLIPTFFIWRDLIEIIFFTSIIYAISLWLKNDLHKNLLGYFYLYCGCFFVTNIASLPTINCFLLMCAPIALLLFIIFHQFTLQKNFVALRNIIPITEKKSHWLETVIQACLININRNKEITCIIEHTDSLENMINTPLQFHADISNELMQLLINSNSFDQTQMLWLTSTGKIVGINGQWKATPQTETHGAKKSTSWIEDTILYSEKTDAIIIKISPMQHTFTIITHGTVYHHVTPSNTITFITKQISTHSSSYKKGETAHAHTPQTAKKQPAAQRIH